MRVPLRRSTPRNVAFALAAVAAALVDAFLGSASAEPGCRLKPKIVGGYAAKVEHWPSFATLRLRHPDTNVTLHFCGGTAITPTWIVTAAHCFDDVARLWRDIVSGQDDSGKLRVEAVIGVGNLDEVADKDVYGVKRWFRHETYEQARDEALASPNPESASRVAELHGNDIALVELSGSWSGPVSKLSLSPQTDPPTPLPREKPALVAGFGATHASGIDIRRFKRSGGRQVYFASIPQLQEVALPLVEAQTCKAYWADAKIDDGQYCAGFEQGQGKDSCNGDSGGPLVALDEKLCPVQIGLVSWGPSPCAPDLKAWGVYTRMSHQAAWLRKHIADLDKWQASK